MCIEGSLGCANSFSGRKISSLATLWRVNHPTAVWIFIFFWRGKKKVKEGESTEFFTTAGYRSQTGRHNNLCAVRVRMNRERERERTGREATLMQYMGNICRNEIRPRRHAGVRLLSLASYREKRHRHRGQTHKRITFRRPCASCPGRCTTGMWWSWEERKRHLNSAKSLEIYMESRIENDKWSAQFSQCIYCYLIEHCLVITFYSLYLLNSTS